MELTPELQQQLTAPFGIDQVEVKPGATNKDKTKALALAYADPRVYQDRLDEVIGAAHWSVGYRRLSDRAIICRLVICGLSREDIGECADQNDPNFWTVASAQAFKRACSAFGLGRYLYDLPQLWADYDANRRRFVSPRRCVEDMYRQAGLLDARRSNVNPATGEVVPEPAPAPRQAADDPHAELRRRAAEVTGKPLESIRPVNPDVLQRWIDQAQEQTA
jgi:hypothetical protein